MGWPGTATLRATTLLLLASSACGDSGDATSGGGAAGGAGTTDATSSASSTTAGTTATGTGAGSSQGGAPGAGGDGGQGGDAGAGGSGAAGGDGSGGEGQGGDGTGGDGIGGAGQGGFSARDSWLLGFGDAGNSQAFEQLAVRDDDGVVLSMWGQGEFSIGDEAFSSPDDPDVAVISIAADGTVEGFISIVADGPSPTITGLVPLPEGGVAVAGYFDGAIDLGEGPVTSISVDSFIAWYDAGGRLVASRIVGGIGAQWIEQATGIDGDHLVAIARSNYPIDWGDGPVVPAGNPSIARIGPDGIAWTRGFARRANQSFANPVVIAADPVAGVALAGNVGFGGLDFGGGYLIDEDQFSGLFVARFDGDGEPIVSHGFGCGSAQLGVHAIDLADDGRVATYGPDPGACEDAAWRPLGAGGFVHVVYDEAGQIAHAPRKTNAGLHPHFDGADLVLLGSGSGPIDFGDGPTQPMGEVDLLGARYDIGGVLISAWRLGPAGAAASRTARSSTGAALFAGRACQDVDLTFATYPHQGSCDAWVARISD